MSHRLIEIEREWAGPYWGTRRDPLDDIRWLCAEVRRLQGLLEPYLPKVADLTGCDPDFTGGLSSEEYVRRMREDEAE